MISRETKAGLVVTASFLGLVGVVLASKMKGGTDADEPYRQELASVLVPPEEPKPIAAAVPAERPTITGLVPARFEGNDLATPMPNEGKTPSTHAEPTPQPAPTEPTLTTEPAPSQPSGEMRVVQEPSTPEPQPQPAAPAPIPTPTEAAPVPQPSAPTPATEPRLTDPTPASTVPDAKPVSRPRESELVPPPPPPSYVSPPIATQPRVTGSDGFSGTPTNPTATTPAPTSPGVNLLRPAPVTEVASQPGVAPSRPRVSPPAGDDAPETRLAQGPAPTAGTGSLPEPTRSTPPPLGTPSTAGSPPIPIPLPTGTGTTTGTTAAQVDSYDELTHTVKQGDTFESISNQHYHADKFGQALLLFNRAHPRAADGVRFDPPKLQPGMFVFVPPLRILEKNYASSIPDHTPLPKPVTPVGTQPKPVQPPTQPSTLGTGPAAGVAPPIGAGAPVKTPTQPAGTTGTSWASPGNDRAYRVRANGEMFLEIARRTLGTGERWPDVYRMNPRFNPEYPVPAGMVLRLPADARIDPEDAP